MLVVVLAGVIGAGPLSFLKRKDAKPTATATPDLHQASGPSTTLPSTLVRRTYARGDCVTWNQDSDARQRASTVVPCDEPHLIEVVGSLDVTRTVTVEPKFEEWPKVYGRLCAADTESLLGGPVDPAGRFATGAIFPSHESWANGDRTVWCGVDANSSSTPRFALFSGRADHARQERVRDVGACFSNRHFDPVPCTGAYDYQVVGNVNVAGRVTQPPKADDTAGWDRIVGNDCSRLAHDFFIAIPATEPSDGSRSRRRAGRRAPVPPAAP